MHIQNLSTWEEASAVSQGGGSRVQQIRLKEQLNSYHQP